MPAEEALSLAQPDRPNAMKSTQPIVPRRITMVVSPVKLMGRTEA
jgi:hypothetical protein